MNIQYTIRNTKKIAYFFFGNKISTGLSIFMFVPIYWTISQYYNGQNELLEQMKLVKDGTKATLKVSDYYGGGQRGGFPKVWGNIIENPDTIIHEVIIGNAYVFRPELTIRDTGEILPIWQSRINDKIIVRVTDNKEKSITFLKNQYEEGIRSNIIISLFISLISFILLFIVFIYDKN